jgi:hypothetical protein
MQSLGQRALAQDGSDPVRSGSSQWRGSTRVTGNPHLTLVSVGCCSRARVCLDRRSETQIFVDPGAFFGSYLVKLPQAYF